MNPSSTEYVTLHTWLRKNHKKPKRCEYCNKVKKWIDWACINGKYTKDINNYKALCRSCHSKIDCGGSILFCKKGHQRSMENSYIHPKTKTEDCKTCKKIEHLKSNKKRYEPGGSRYRSPQDGK